MVNSIFGGCFLLIGLIFLFHPAKCPAEKISYKSILATTTTSGFYLAQRWCRNMLLLFGLVQLSMGIMINYLHLNYLSIVWLLVVSLFVLVGVLRLEYKLRHYLIRIGQLPVQYR